MAVSTQTYSEIVREIARREFVLPLATKQEVVRIRLGDLQAKAREQGVPRQDTNLVATAIESKKLFWGPLGLEMISVKGQSRRVDAVFEYRFVGTPQTAPFSAENDPLLGIVGILKDAFPEGAESFLRELRRDKEPFL